MYAEDSDNLLETIDDNNIDKTLICARTTKQIIGLITQSDFCLQLAERGYSWMTITSKTGAIIDGKKVNREEFFNTLNTWGKDPEKKFVCIHHSILSEGINVNGLEPKKPGCYFHAEHGLHWYQSEHRTCDPFG